jgi:hypothetical protein
MRLGVAVVTVCVCSDVVVTPTPHAAVETTADRRRRADFTRSGAAVHIAEMNRM